MIILVDAMGGDNAPEALVNGCIDAVNEADGFDILLLGDSARINEILKERNYTGSRLKIHNTTEIINNDDVPLKAIKSKKDSSMVVGFKMLKEGKGDVFISAGNSGALLAGSTLILDRLPQVSRPAIAALVPTKKGTALIIDAGANTNCKPVNYLQFAIMGSIYIKELLGIEKPKIGLLNVGSEEIKGNANIKNAYALLSKANINFIGNVEGKDLPEGNVDVLVCDGFMGNVILKFYEGSADFFLSSLKNIFMSNVLTKAAALIIKKELKKLLKTLDEDSNGGAPILGVNGLVIKTHGNSNSKTVKNVVLKAKKLAQASFAEQIRTAFENLEDKESSNVK